MPPQAIIILVLIAAVVLLGRAFIAGNPANAPRLVRHTLGGTLIVISVLLVVRGLFPLAIPIFLLGLMVLGTGNVLGLNFPWSQKSPGQKSSVRTQILAMELDHDSGDLDGEVLVGQFAGQRLGDLSLESLHALRSECLASDDQSAALLDAYLDRMHPDWRGEGDAPGSAPASEGDMSVDEAYNILGLAPGTGAAEIRKAHRRMMKRFHPDHGGSEYLARKINQARDILLAAES
ncbi:MAG: DnaJ domain-containing protein [Aestuariivirgaceae bacterium]